MSEKELQVNKVVLRENLTSKKGNKYNALIITFKNGKTKQVLMSDLDVFNATRE